MMSSQMSQVGRFVQSRVLAGSSFVLAQIALASTALAQATEAPVQTPGSSPAASGGGAAPQWLNFALMGGMIFFLYLFIIRPQAKRQKEHKTFIDSLKTGQEIITSSGLIGRITSISDNIVTVDLGNGSVRVLKSAVSGELNKTGVGGTPATTTVS